MVETKLKTDPETEVFLSPVAQGECSPEHDAWMKAQIEGTLAKKKAGEMGFTPLDAVMRRFSFYAR